jgi:hypothetical protein
MKIDHQPPTALDEESGAGGRPLKPRGRAFWAKSDVEESIVDDARRSISVRIKLSELGRLKAIAKRLETRESNVFRYVLRIGLARLTNVLDGVVVPAQRWRLLIQLVGELSNDFGMDARACLDLLNSVSSGSMGDLAPEDLELVNLAAKHPRVVLEYLERLTGGPVAATNLVASLSEYLQAKYPDAGVNLAG